MSTNNFFPPAYSPPLPDWAVGVSEIGILPFTWQETVISQYANSDKMMNFIASFGSAMDMQQELDQFYNIFWNVQTAQGYGLDVWGRIVGADRVVEMSISDWFGFEEGNTFFDYEPFNQQAFYSGQMLTEGFRLDDTPFRQLIYAKAALNLWDGSVAQCNSILQLLFPMDPATGHYAYVVDNQDMSMTYWFNWAVTRVEAAIAITTHVLPRPAGVRVTYHRGTLP